LTRRIPVSTALLFALAALCSDALAQESIFDTQNPNVVGDDDEEEGDGDEPSGPQNIFDSENPLSTDDGPELLDHGFEIGSSADPGEESSLWIPTSWFTGNYRGELFFDTGFEGENEDIYLFHNRLELRAKIDFSRNWRAVIEGRLDWRLWGESSSDNVDYFFNADNRQGVFEPTLRDAYVSGRLDNLYLTIGQQNIVWGAGTFTAPADVINPVDYRGGTFDTPASQRVQVFAVDASMVFDQVGLQLVLVPFFEPHRFDTFGSDWAFFRSEGGLGSGLPVFGFIEGFLDSTIQPRVQSALTATEFPDARFENMSAGARFTSTAGGMDLGLGYFFGWDRTPFFEIDDSFASFLNLVASDPNGFFSLSPEDPDYFQRLTEIVERTTAINESRAAGNALLLSEYRRRHTIEVDAVRYLGPIGVRLESTYTFERTFYLEGLPRDDGQAPGVDAVRLPVVNSALALSYELGESFNFQVEGYWVHAFDIPDGRQLLLPQDFYGVAGITRLKFDAWDALADTFLGDISLRFAGVYGIATEDYIIYPTITWDFSDSASASLGAMFFGGPKVDEQVSVGGLFDDNDQAYFSIDAAF